eukprot:jgi/Mesvir1/29114/Mv18419-RA.1
MWSCGSITSRGRLESTPYGTVGASPPPPGMPSPEAPGSSNPSRTNSGSLSLPPNSNAKAAVGIRSLSLNKDRSLSGNSKSGQDGQSFWATALKADAQLAGGNGGMELPELTLSPMPRAGSANGNNQWVDADANAVSQQGGGGGYPPPQQQGGRDKVTSARSIQHLRHSLAGLPRASTAPAHESGGSGGQVAPSGAASNAGYSASSYSRGSSNEGSLTYRTQQKRPPPTDPHLAEQMVPIVEAYHSTIQRLIAQANDLKLQSTSKRKELDALETKWRMMEGDAAEEGEGEVRPPDQDAAQAIQERMKDTLADIEKLKHQRMTMQYLEERLLRTRIKNGFRKETLRDDLSKISAEIRAWEDGCRRAQHDRMQIEHTLREMAEELLAERVVREQQLDSLRRAVANQAMLIRSVEENIQRSHEQHARQLEEEAQRRAEKVMEQAAAFMRMEAMMQERAEAELNDSRANAFLRLQAISGLTEPDDMVDVLLHKGQAVEFQKQADVGDARKRELIAELGALQSSLWEHSGGYIESNARLVDKAQAPVNAARERLLTLRRGAGAMDAQIISIKTWFTMMLHKLHAFEDAATMQDLKPKAISYFQDAEEQVVLDMVDLELRLTNCIKVLNAASIPGFLDKAIPPNSVPVNGTLMSALWPQPSAAELRRNSSRSLLSASTPDADPSTRSAANKSPGVGTRGGGTAGKPGSLERTSSIQSLLGGAGRAKPILGRRESLSLRKTPSILPQRGRRPTSGIINTGSSNNAGASSLRGPDLAAASRGGDVTSSKPFGIEDGDSGETLESTFSPPGADRDGGQKFGGGNPLISEYSGSSQGGAEGSRPRGAPRINLEVLNVPLPSGGEEASRPSSQGKFRPSSPLSPNARSTRVTAEMLLSSWSALNTPPPPSPFNVRVAPPPPGHVANAQSPPDVGRRVVPPESQGRPTSSRSAVTWEEGSEDDDDAHGHEGDDEEMEEDGFVRTPRGTCVPSVAGREDIKRDSRSFISKHKRNLALAADGQNKDKQKPQNEALYTRGRKGWLFKDNPAEEPPASPLRNRLVLPTPELANELATKLRTAAHVDEDGLDFARKGEKEESTPERVTSPIAGYLVEQLTAKPPQVATGVRPPHAHAHAHAHAHTTTGGRA